MGKNIYKYIVKWYAPMEDKTTISEGYCFGTSSSTALTQIENLYGEDCIEKVSLTYKGCEFADVLEMKVDGKEVKEWDY